MLDFTTSLYARCSSKVGESKPEVKAGAFITVMLALGLVRKVKGRLVMNKGHENDEITPTMLRYIKPKRLRTEVYVRDSSTGKKHHEGKDPDELEMLFKEHVEVD